MEFLKPFFKKVLKRRREKAPQAKNKRRNNMLLAVDVSNKNISFAIFDDLTSEPTVKFRIASDIKKTADEYAVTLAQLLNFSGIDYS